MTSREAILAAVRAARPAATSLPALPSEPPPAGRDERLATFTGALRAAAADVMILPPGSLWPALGERFGAGRAVAAPGVDHPQGVERLEAGTPIARLAAVDTLVCRGELGVAENGAVWLPESRCGHRAAPFLAQRVVILLDRSAVVPTMHEAYARIRAEDEGFGVFVAGPSKTADIEQALVIGAHGPVDLLVVLVDEPGPVPA